MIVPTIFLGFNKTCNLDCSYCFIPKELRTQPIQPGSGIEFARDVRDKLLSEGVIAETIVLFSAEITTYSAEEVGSIINILHEVTPLVHMITNGIQLSKPEYTRVLMNTVEYPENLRVQLSIDGPSEITIENRGKLSSYSDKASVLLHMYDIETVIRCTVTNEHIGKEMEFTEWVDHIHKNRGQEINLMPVHPTTQLEANELTWDTHKELVEFCNNVQDIDEKVTVTSIDEVYDCNTVMWYPDGSMTGCTEIAEDKAIANWKTMSIDEIVVSRRNKYSDVPNECNECEYNSECALSCYVHRTTNGYAYDCRKGYK